MKNLAMYLPTDSVVLPLHAPTVRDGQAVDELSRMTGLDPTGLSALLCLPLDRYAERGIRLVARLDVGQNIRSTVTLALVPLRVSAAAADTSPEEICAALRDHLSHRRPDADSRCVALPCGPAVASLIFGRYDLMADETRTGRPAVIPTFQAEFLVPLRSDEGIVVLDVRTTDEATWPQVSQQAARIARSMRLLDEDEPSLEGEHLVRL